MRNGDSRKLDMGLFLCLPLAVCISFLTSLSFSKFSLGRENADVFNNFREENRLLIEEANLKIFERPIAQELGEPTRENYLATKGTIKTVHSTHLRTPYIRPWWEVILWFLFPSGRQLVEHNI